MIIKDTKVTDEEATERFWGVAYGHGAPVKGLTVREKEPSIYVASRADGTELYEPEIVQIVKAQIKAEKQAAVDAVKVVKREGKTFYVSPEKGDVSEAEAQRLQQAAIETLRQKQEKPSKQPDMIPKGEEVLETAAKAKKTVIETGQSIAKKGADEVVGVVEDATGVTQVRETVKKLGTLTLGDSGEEVKTLQRLIGMKGYQVDGKFGQETQDYLIAFQKKNGLAHEADGILGKNTVAKLPSFVHADAASVDKSTIGNIAPGAIGGQNSAKGTAMVKS